MGWPPPFGLVAGAALAVVLRFLSLIFSWKLPAWRQGRHGLFRLRFAEFSQQGFLICTACAYFSARRRRRTKEARRRRRLRRRRRPSTNVPRATVVRMLAAPRPGQHRREAGVGAFEQLRTIRRACCVRNSAATRSRSAGQRARSYCASNSARPGRAAAQQSA